MPSVKPPPLKLKARGMAYDRTTTVTVLFGFETGDVGRTYTVDPRFDMRPYAAQEAVVSFCEHLGEDKRLHAFHVSCWPREFREYLRRHGRTFPSRAIERDLPEYLSKAPKWVHNHLGFKEGHSRIQVAWLAVDFRVEFDSHSSGRQTETYMALWEKVVADEMRSLGVQAGGSQAQFLGPAVPCAEVFERAEAELRVIGSALSSWFVSVGCALAAVLGFTRNLSLSALTTYAIFATGACSLYAITSLFHWRFGLMEAVSLLVFCGFSVDYPLHIVQSYVQERHKGVGAALYEVGGAVVSGCVTTCGAAAFLLLCEIRIFTRFGQVLIVNMSFSLVFALLWVPAVIEGCVFVRQKLFRGALDSAPTRGASPVVDAPSASDASGVARERAGTVFPQVPRLDLKNVRRYEPATLPAPGR